MPKWRHVAGKDAVARVTAEDMGIHPVQISRVTIPTTVDQQNMKFLFLIPFSLCVVAGCTTTSEIIIDQKGVDMSRYKENLADCESYAEQVAVAKKAAKGAASGAAAGGAIGSVSKGRDAGEGAAIGAITGVTKGLSAGERDEVRVVKNCLRGRGYRVLN